ncbi:hypothetical protein [Microbacterium oxydans]|uniref:Uncharacterized protein n=1 Tax=Microbacterium oxydans TaxID=82380 RepID=A0A0F0L810_9MICO|nr:hypothetical protein [Microbacterium oxydans]KJL28824.1 hypothetical protein RS83_02305 [Microbacterium oxydans]
MATTRIKEELQASGRVGPAAFKMMTDVFESLITKFSALRARETAEDLRNGFFLDKGTGYVLAIGAAADDDAAARITYRWGTRWLVDKSRHLPFGALRNRLEKRLERSALFAPSRVAHHWFLADGDDESYLFTTSQLVAIADAADIELHPWGNGNLRIGKAGELEQLIQSLLECAGRLHAAEITVICGNRFPLMLQLGDASESMVDANSDTLTNSAADSDSAFVTAEMIRIDRLADDIFPQLTDEEVSIFRYWGDVPRLIDELNRSRSGVYKAMDAARRHLVELAGGGEEGRQVMLAVMKPILDRSASVPSTQDEREDTRAI